MLLLQCTATPPAGGRHWNSCNARAHELRGQGVLLRRRSLRKNGTRAMHCPTIWEQWAVQFLQCSASLPGGSGQCNTSNAECLRGTAAPCGPSPPAKGTGSPAQEVVAAYGAPAGDGSPHRRGPIS